MVQGQWLLLAFMACSPESLRIHIPKRGVESVQQEDLRRAIWAMQSTEPTEWFAGRAESLGLIPIKDSGCYVHTDASTAQGTRLLVSDVNPVSTAVVASLAKSLHGIEHHRKSGWQFCLGQPIESLPQWQDVYLSTWMDVVNRPFVELHFISLEQSVRQVVEAYLVKP